MTTRASRLVRRTCLPFDGIPCSPDSPGSDLLATAPGATFLFQNSPLERDQLSRLVTGDHPFCTGAKQRFSFSGFPGPYRAAVDVPEGCYMDQELDEIRTTILRLNYFAKVPITRFEWYQRPPAGSITGPDGIGSHYSPYYHAVLLDHQPGAGLHVPRIEGTIGELVHEIGHGIYRKGFFRDRDWSEVYYRALAHRNYEIVDDSNYLQDSQDDVGHPHSNRDEAFASSLRAYFLHADQFAAYIQNAKTPASMRIFGKLVWTFMRDRVFRGFVFTKDDVDPFAAERFQALLSQLPNAKESLVLFFRREGDAAVRRDVAFFLNFDWDWKDDPKVLVPALTLALRDPDDSVPISVTGPLMLFGTASQEAVPVLIECLRHKNPFVRQRAAHTLGSIGPGARCASPALQVALRDVDPDVSRAARNALKEIQAP